MNQKEIGELRRRWKPEGCAVPRIYGCFVNSSREIVSDLDESLGNMPLEEMEKYLELLKKVFSGTLGKNLIDIPFSIEQVKEGMEHGLLMALKDSQLKDAQARQTFYENVMEHLDMGDSNYLLLMACDSYDVPLRGKNDEDSGESDEVFTYFLCCVCPVKESKPTLGYFPGDNEFHCSAGLVVSAPELGFMFPAFDDRRSNIYNALFYSRKPDEIHLEFVDGIFHTELPMSAMEQREEFESALYNGLEDGCQLEVIQAVHEQLSEQIARHKESKSAEPLTMSAEEIGVILQDCGVPQEQVDVFQSRCEEEFGEGAILSPANIIDPTRFEIKAGKATVLIDPIQSYLVESRIIDGRKYLLIPVETDDVTVNGMPVRIVPPEESSETVLDEISESAAEDAEPETVPEKAAEDAEPETVPDEVPEKAGERSEPDEKENVPEEVPAEDINSN